MKPLSYHPEARSEMMAAHAWYAELSLQAADGFFEEIFPVLDRMQARPRLYPLHLYGTHRAVLNRYPFSII